MRTYRSAFKCMLRQFLANNGCYVAFFLICFDPSHAESATLLGHLAAKHNAAKYPTCFEVAKGTWLVCEPVQEVGAIFQDYSSRAGGYLPLSVIPMPAIALKMAYFHPNVYARPWIERWTTAESG